VRGGAGVGLAPAFPVPPCLPLVLPLPPPEFEVPLLPPLGEEGARERPPLFSPPPRTLPEPPPPPPGAAEQYHQDDNEADDPAG
jgi:hypothetical protein